MAEANMTLIVHDDGPRIAVAVLAERLGIEARSASALVKKHRAEFERFGHLRFEIAEIPPAARGRPATSYLLNEDQSYLLATLARSSDRAVRVKAELVAAFKRARVTTEVSLLQRVHALESDLQQARHTGQVGSRLMHHAKTELRRVRGDMDTLTSKMQLSLFAPVPVQGTKKRRGAA